MLSYRTTPFTWYYLSSAQLLMGWRICSNLPTSPTLLKPESLWPNLQTFHSQGSSYKIKQEKQYDRRHRARDLVLVEEGTPVFMTNSIDVVPGSVTECITHRSYNVDIPSGMSEEIDVT